MTSFGENSNAAQLVYMMLGKMHSLYTHRAGIVAKGHRSVGGWGDGGIFVPQVFLFCVCVFVCFFSSR